MADLEACYEAAAELRQKIEEALFEIEGLQERERLGGADAGECAERVKGHEAWVRVATRGVLQMDAFIAAQRESGGS
jgi:hypothetical protein